MFLGYRLKSLRKQKHLSQSDLGKLLGVSKVSISGYENGLRVPSMEILLLMLNVFDISADYILGREIKAVCEGSDDNNIFLSKSDIDIINEIKHKPDLYNKIAENPKRFFNGIDKNNI